MKRTCLAIVLAAGESTRMKSSMSKVLHPVAGRPMIAHVVESLVNAAISSVALVLGRDAEAVQSAAARSDIDISAFLQTERLGTSHAVLAARDAIAKGYDDILVVFGDTPLITAAPLLAARQGLADGNDVVVIGFHTDNPTGYGRLLVKDGELMAIREEKDATEAESENHLVQQRPDGDQWRQGAGSARRIGNSQCQGRILPDRSRRDRPCSAARPPPSMRRRSS
jgi:bifunctional UDP-N-acetylglucosamine pyrophosphorylase/glucosamine-1-phosphate N-acetyltransferase